MAILDHNGRLFGKISIVDVIVLLVVALLGVAVYFKTHQPQTGTSVEEQVITYQLQLYNQPQYVVDALMVEDNLYDKDRSTGGSLGQITAIETAPGTQLAQLDDGTVAYVPSEDRFNVLLTLEGKGLYTPQEGYLLNRIYALGANSSRNFVTKHAWFTGTVLNIQSQTAPTA